MTDKEAFQRGVLLAETFAKMKAPPDPSGWWVSEKLDGVRAYWNGSDFYSRNGLLFNAPKWFKAGLPKDAHLDGELWCGRDAFERCVQIIKYQKGSTADEWQHLSFLVFDAPVFEGRDDHAYEERVAFVERATKASEHAKAVEVRRVRDQAHVDDLLQSVLAAGGEGLMLREPGSRYVRVRSSSLLKVKTFVDAEAKVVDHAPGKNRLQGMLGALQCEMPVSGVRFEVGTGFADAERNLVGAKRRWPVGSVISFKYQNLTAKGVPRFPVFLRARADKTWDEVVADAQKDVDDKASGAGGPPALSRTPSLLMSSVEPRPSAPEASPHQPSVVSVGAKRKRGQ